MRTGLVVLGAVIAVLGAGLFGTLIYLTGGPVTTNTISFEDPSLSTHTNQTWVISPSATAATSVTLSWTASAAANVSLFPATACLSPLGSCPAGPAAFNWSLAVSGKGTDSSTNSPEYLLEVTNPGSTSLRFSAVVSMSYRPASPLSVWDWGMIAVGGVVLLAIGGIAVFLGLFLPGGVYQNVDEEAPTVRSPSLPPEEPDSGPDRPSP